jgi:deazaflavin-dependent oxidoreductase (nitroreductase family)
MSRIAHTYARISPKLAHKPGSTAASRLHARLHRLTRGRVGSRLLGADVLTLTTTGRRTAQPRHSPMFYLEHDGSYAVVASNAASPRPPAWFLNLEAQPNATAHVRGVSLQVRSRLATGGEVEELWPRFVDMYPGYAHYRSIATRTMPVLILEPR